MRADPHITDAALRVLRDGGRLRALRFVSDWEQLPLAITELGTLQRLSIVAPNLSGLPREIGCLDRLRVLSLKTFQLGSLPRTIGSLRHLRRLSIDSHQLRRLPREIANLTDLRRVELIFRGHFVPKKWGPRPYFRARFEQTLPQLFELLATLPRLSALTLGEPPHVWLAPEPILREIPDELCLLKALKNLTLIDCQVPVRLPLGVRELERLETLSASGTQFVHSEDELRAALPRTRLELGPEPSGESLLWGRPLDDYDSIEDLTSARDLLLSDNRASVLANEIALAIGWLHHEGGRYREAIKAAESYERKATSMKNAIFVRLLWADATLSAEPDSKDTAIEILDKLAPIRLDGLAAVLIAWHWLITARAFRCLNQPDAEREAIQEAARSFESDEPLTSPFLRRLSPFVRKFIVNADP